MTAFEKVYFCVSIAVLTIGMVINAADISMLHKLVNKIIEKVNEMDENAALLFKKAFDMKNNGRNEQ